MGYRQLFRCNLINILLPITGTLPQRPSFNIREWAAAELEIETERPPKSRDQLLGVFHQDPVAERNVSP